jgi:hypothetical protein
VPDPTGPELLDALERLVEASGTWKAPARDAIRRLRSLLRTPEETAVLRAAVTFAVTRSASQSS